jgi:hypothetical protein
VTYFVAKAGIANRPGDETLAEGAFRAWEAAAGGALRFEAAPEQTAGVRVYWIADLGGHYSETVPILANGRRGAAVYVRPVARQFGSDVAALAQHDPLFRDAVVYLTCVHEIGHALGLMHTANFEDIMYGFGYGGDIPGYFRRYRDKLKARSDIPQHPGLSANDMRHLNELYPSVTPRSIAR